MSGAAISLRSLGKTFGDGTRALLPQDLNIGAGEILGLLGPSGCGKTTLLRLIAGLEKADAGGRVIFDEQDVTALPVERRNVGMVFQTYALFPNMTVAANVGYGLRVRGVGRAERAARVEEVLTMCEVAALADRRIETLSGGQRQRVALARAVAPRPRVLLLDEPLSALDASLRDRLRDDLAALLRRFGITAVFVTHDQAEALAIADCVAVMQAGWIVQVDSPRGLYAAPADAWVAGFVGGAMRLGGRREGAALHLPGGRIDLPEATPAGAAFLVRPGGLRLCPAEGAALTGHVMRATFLGDRLRVEIAGATDNPLLLDAPPETDVVPGARVGLSLAPGALIVTTDSASERLPA